jgi:Prenyltransferase and squalene oxidase repeat
MDSAACLQILAARQRDDGGFAGREGGASRPDATAWAVLGLRAAGQGSEGPIERARRQLVHAQSPDGGMLISPRHPASSWPTPLALLAWYGWAEGRPAAQKALDFLDQVKVTTFQTEDRLNAIDSTLRGWAWIDGTTCWVEPTALCVFAFERYGRPSVRVKDGIALLLDRQLPHGGWNFGNTLVYGSELLPAEEYVGVALTGLAGHCDAARIAPSIAFIEGRLPTLRTPLALGWGILGLAAWGRRPAEADRWISECLDRQKTVGPFDSALLALLLVAGHCPTGLQSLFAPSVS